MLCPVGAVDKVIFLVSEDVVGEVEGVEELAGDFVDVVVFSKLVGVFLEGLGFGGGLEEVADGLGEGGFVGAVYDGGVVVLAGMFGEEGPTGGVDEDGAVEGEVFDEFGGVAGEGTFFGFYIKGEYGDYDVSTGLEGEDFFLGQGVDFDAGEVESGLEEFGFWGGSAEDEFCLEVGFFVEGLGDAEEAFFLADDDAGVDDAVGWFRRWGGECGNFVASGLEFEGVWDEGGFELEASLEIDVVAFGDDESVLGGVEDWGFVFVDEVAFEGGDGGAADGDVHVVGVEGESGCAVCLVGGDHTGPVWVDGEDGVCVDFSNGFESELAEDGGEGEAEVAFPSPDVGDFGEEEFGDGGFVDFDAFGDGGLGGAGGLSVFFCNDGDALGVQLGDEVAEDGGGAADVWRKVGGDDHHSAVLVSCWHLSGISLAKEKRG